MDIRTKILNQITDLHILVVLNVSLQMLILCFPFLRVFGILVSITVYFYADTLDKLFEEYRLENYRPQMNNINTDELSKPTIKPNETMAILEPFTRCNPIMTNDLVSIKGGRILFPKTTNTKLMDGFAFRLKVDGEIYKIGPITDNNTHDIDTKKIFIKKGTPYFSANDNNKFSHNTENDEYCHLEEGVFIKLLKGTLFNDNTNELKLAKDTMVKVL